MEKYWAVFLLLSCFQDVAGKCPTMTQKDTCGEIKGEVTSDCSWTINGHQAPHKLGVNLETLTPRVSILFGGNKVFISPEQGNDVELKGGSCVVFDASEGFYCPVWNSITKCQTEPYKGPVTIKVEGSVELPLSYRIFECEDSKTTTQRLEKTTPPTSFPSTDEKISIYKTTNKKIEKTTGPRFSTKTTSSVSLFATSRVSSTGEVVTTTYYPWKSSPRPSFAPSTLGEGSPTSGNGFTATAMPLDKKEAGKELVITLPLVGVATVILVMILLALLITRKRSQGTTDTVETLDTSIQAGPELDDVTYAVIGDAVSPKEEVGNPIYENAETEVVTNAIYSGIMGKEEVLNPIYDAN